MKRMIPFAVSAALLLGLLSACQQSAEQSEPPGSQDGPAALDVLNAVLVSSGYNDQSGDLEFLTADEDSYEFLNAYIENAYGLETAWEDAAVIRGTGASAFELAVLRLEDNEAAVQAAAKLMSYIFNRQGDFAGYAPDQAELVANGSIGQDGPYAALFICPDTDRAEAAFTAAVNGSVQPRPEPSDAIPKVKSEVGSILDFLLDQCSDAHYELERLDSSNKELLSNYIGSFYGLEPMHWEDAAIVRGTRNSAFEIAVLRVSDEDMAWDVITMLNSYLDQREAEFVDIPDQFELLYDASAFFVAGEEIGTFVILPVCKNSDDLVINRLEMALMPESIGNMDRHQHIPSVEFDSDYPDRYKFVQPNKDDMSLYDTSAILAAWEVGSPSGLSKYDKDIYNAAKKILGKVLRAGMTDLEKESAVYSWIVLNVNYDWTHQDAMRETPRESFTPYGGLVKHTAVCLGYATAFQLLMDLAGVECITVPGAAFGSMEDHGWNMVRLDGNWYCVDVTWDANYREQGVTRGREDEWSFFNITSNEMASTNHQWDYANTPEAATAGNGRG